jgi:S1-C subfamily serine protease
LLDADPPLSTELHVLTGDRAGRVVSLSGTECTVGRHTSCTLRFGTDAEHGVSAHHARFVRTPSGWVLHDLGSTNHTWLNGRRLETAALLRDGDRIALGIQGPVLEIRIPATPGVQRIRRKAPRPETRAAVATACVCLAAAAALHLQRGDELPRPAPSAPPAGPATAAAPGLRERKMRGQPAGSLRAGIPRAPSPPSAREAPRGEVARPGIHAAAGTDPPVDRPSAILRANQPAVARIWVEAANGEVSTGTAFAVRADGVLATSRHVVKHGGGSPRRVAVQFTGSTQVWRARLVAVSGEWDLALVKVDDIVGAVPTVRGLNLRPDTLPPGAPVALAGFPGGGDAAEGAPARPVSSTAAFATARGCCVQVYARSAAGGSGSPLFDAEGSLLGVLFGGDPRAPRPVLYAVPAAAVARLMEDVP